MARPVILAVDDDPPVLRAVERDLRARYGHDQRIIAADSGQRAVEVLAELKLRATPVAVIVTDQRMPGMSGTELLAQARELAPDAKRVLLTAYADTDAAIEAINSIRLDHYILKPWDPPEERLYPVLDDLLADWQAQVRPAFEGVRLVGSRWSPRVHEIKDFLARNLVPYRWLELEPPTGTVGGQPDATAAAAVREAEQLVQAASVTPAELPLVVFPDGSHLAGPTNLQVAEQLGLRTRPTAPFYDLAIVGGGPAGLAAAVYGASEGLKTVLIEREAPGGQAGTTSRIENYLGFPVGLSGADLTRRAVSQASRLGAEILTPQEAGSLRLGDPYRTLVLADGSELNAHAVLIAVGVAYRQIDAPGVAELTGRGVFYGAAITEALQTSGQDVAIVGGGNSAGQAAVYLSGFARRVTLLVRGASLGQGMSQYLVDQITATPNITVRLGVNLRSALGDQGLRAIEVEQDGAGPVDTLEVSALFLFIGARPNTDWLAGIVDRDTGGFIETGGALASDGERPHGWALPRAPYLLETSAPGVFAAGDVRHHSVKRIASAVGEGSMAVQFVHQYLAGR
ncbi:MAG: FAD-dependent oxidoreductase [Candidatus Limnocylindrales bacterium]